jgi:hypothetical protein
MRPMPDAFYSYGEGLAVHSRVVKHFCFLFPIYQQVEVLDYQYIYI